MADIDSRLEQDKAMRDAARRLIEADVGFVRDAVEERSVPKRVADGASQVSRSLADRALDYAGANPLAIGGGIVAIGLIVFRNPILDFAIGLLEDDEAGPEPPEGAEPPRSPVRSIFK